MVAKSSVPNCSASNYMSGQCGGSAKVGFLIGGKIKLNTDGCARGDPGEGGFGGLFRDETGLWICGYVGKLENCSCLEAEIWGIYRGLTIAYEKGFKEFTVETDSSVAEELLKDGSVHVGPLRSLVQDSEVLMQRCNANIQHIMREGNGCADFLANMGANQQELLMVMEDPPDELRGRLVAEMLGVVYLRP